jgi:hypothetical protein
MTPEVSQSNEGFHFTERERLFERISDKRFRALLAEEQTSIHEIEESSNTYGDFLFVTVSRPGGERRVALTIWGMGYHEYRERWLTHEWYWYEANISSGKPQPVIPKAEAEELLQKRLEEIGPRVTPAQQSKRAQLFEMLADLTDEDGAYTELEDLGEAGMDWLLGGDDE